MEDTNVNSVEKKSGGMFVVGLLIILALGYVGFKGIRHILRAQAGQVAGATVQAANDSTTNISVADTTTPSPTPEIKVDQTFTVDAANFSFSPKIIKVKKGQVIKIILNNKEGFHDLKIDELNVNTGRIGANQTAEAIFTADKTGSFQYYCSVGSHRKLGMWGTLIVQ